ncbi:myozenin-2 isoform X2 [Pangasianodon hypophthalmus]|uniref:myozenin-2 isoform X2 n=1 Tax=Pangasianodon hypophthalmus TaxID=310915 RepID=UPI002307D5CA|nr:myozenin-2 isoform X2 [Pangasianodon hypophthalmus]
MQTANNNMNKQWQQQARALSREARGEGLNLGKKASIPKDVMIEELNLTSNRGSRMFQERQRRVDRFTVENTADAPAIIYDGLDQMQAQSQVQSASQAQGGKENTAYPVAGKHSLVTTLMETVSKKGSPSILAPELQCHLGVPCTVRGLFPPSALKQRSPRICQAPQWTGWSNGPTSTEHLAAGPLVTYPSLTNSESIGVKAPSVYSLLTAESLWYSLFWCLLIIVTNSGFAADGRISDFNHG